MYQEVQSATSTANAPVRGSTSIAGWVTSGSQAEEREPADYVDGLRTMPDRWIERSLKYNDHVPARH